MPQPNKKKPAAGAPGQGAGGQKAAGQAAPPTPKPAAGPKPPQSLTPQQRQQMTQAATKGNLDQYLAKHQGVAAHQQKVTAGGNKGQQALQQKVQGLQGKASTGAPATGASGGKEAGAQAAAAPPAPGTPPAGAGTTAPAAPANPSVDEALNSMYGADASKKFQQDWYGDNPLKTAEAAANRLLEGNLASVRNRYAQSGFGSSGREALAEGQAVGDVDTNLGAKLADLGTQVKGTDMDRLANMFATWGQQDIQGKAVAGDLNQQLANLGTGLTGIGASEQAIPGTDVISALLANMSNQPTYTEGRQRQPRK